LNLRNARHKDDPAPLDAACACPTCKGFGRTMAIEPDLVIANMEENRREDVAQLRAWGIPVYVTYPRMVEEGIRLVQDLGALTGRLHTALASVTR